MNTDIKIQKALDIAFQYGQIDGSHHKMWIIDQMVRVLTGELYNSWVQEYKEDSNGEEVYEWDEGINP